MLPWLFLVLLLSLPGACALEGYLVEEVVTFATPDSGYEALQDFITSASRSLYVNVYTFNSMEIAELLAEAEERGVEVTLMVEESPVGGISSAEGEVLERLLEAGAEVYYSSDSRVRFNHAKYAIADNASVLVTSENFGYNSFPMEGGYGNRGWGVIIYDAGVASYFLDLFFEDLGKAGKVSKVEHAPGKWEKKVAGGYKPRFKKELYKGEFVVRPFTAPEDALDNILRLISSANRSLYIEQFYIYKYWGPRKTGSPSSTPNLFLEAAINASRRGVEVKILLDSTWYNVEMGDPVSNYNTLLYLRELAKREGLNLEAKLADMGLKIHNKGLIVDGELVLVSSVNWNEHSPTKNREIGVIIQGEPAEYFAEVFMYDWRGGAGRSHYYLLLLVIILAGLGVKIFFKKD
jgi:phosphatidylserine/phosphatidylglycerophosphate/cardiolipin synthase-like enzyme